MGRPHAANHTAAWREILKCYAQWQESTWYLFLHVSVRPVVDQSAHDLNVVFDNRKQKRSAAVLSIQNKHNTD
jgi:hypothetical protein